jgi:sulfatase modifying factor 1
MNNETSSPPTCCMPAFVPRESATGIELTIALVENGTPATTSGMVFIEGGSFLMGTDGPEAWKADGEGPVREVTVSAFWMDECAVTNAQFAAFVEATNYVTEAENFGWSYVFHKHVSAENKKLSRGYSSEAQWWLGIGGAYWRKPEGPGSNLKKREEHPVVHVSWNDAVAYCAWAGKKLPTEAQWEYAARGGLVQKLYPWGDELNPKGKNGKPEHRCNIWQGKFPVLDTGTDGWTNTAPVKTFAPNAFGLYHTSGNVWEWCRDWFSPDHSKDLPNDPTGPEFGTHKITKGGSFLCHESYCNRYRLAARTANTPDSTTSHTGFRCVL